MTTKLTSPKQIAEVALRTEIVALMAICTDKQRAGLDRLIASGKAAGWWPNGLESMNQEDLSSTLMIVHRTIKANEARDGK